MISLIDEDKKPKWLEYPAEYMSLIETGKDEFSHWYLLDKEQLWIRYKGLQKRYPDRKLFPFARDDDSDDVACWEEGKFGKVILIHDFASSGYENKLEFNTFDEWYSYILSQEEN